MGYSGGLDSTVLLHALVACRALAKGFPALSAVHIHHGLQPMADAWETQCRQNCARLDVSYTAVAVEAFPRRRESPEARAREVRYAALETLVGADDGLVTAHHADDQIETVFLQLLRGAGPEGLSAMPAYASWGHGWHLRPLLSFTRESLLAYAVTERLAWIEDPTNTETAPDRNFLRHEVLPVLRRRWPGMAGSIGRAASLQAQASMCLKSIAEEDLVRCVGSTPANLSVGALRALGPERRANVLRAWIRVSGFPVPQARQLAQADSAVLAAATDAQPKLHWPGAVLRRYRDDLYLMRPVEVHDAGQEFVWDASTSLPIKEAGCVLEPEALRRMGFSRARGLYTVRFRRGGERCRPSGQKHHRALKKLFQEAGIPPWLRERVPLIYDGDRLVCVYGYWLCDD